MEAMSSQVLTIPEVARVLRVSVAHCYELGRTGKIPVEHLGNRMIVPRSRLEHWLATGELRPAPAQADLVEILRAQRDALVAAIERLSATGGGDASD